MDRRVTIVTEGSRGDWQPSVAAGAALRQAGFQVQLLGSTDVKAMAQQYDLFFVETWPISSKDYSTQPKQVEAITENNFVKLTAAAAAIREPMHELVLTRTVEALKTFKPDVVLTSLLSFVETLFICKALKIPVLFFGLQPMLASRHVGVMGVFPVLPDVFRLNLRLWDCLNRHFVSMVNTTAGPILEKLLQVPKRSFSASLAELYEHCSCHPRYPILFGISGTLHLPLPPDFTEMCKVLGPMELEKQEGKDFGEEEDSAALERFLAEGEAPVYIGYGSMICRSGRYMTELSVRALMLAQRRGVLLGGFAEMSEQKVEDLELLAYCKEKA
ncbi:unnamed protein product [Effrenium voratum]|uniref:Glycosyltransferase n=1 Tax=Effrenium voratum TaxID=2562239 RepID=A0AA36JCQ2_9DINO|nr:unnamed protein product [Effrenium voratum]